MSDLRLLSVRSQRLSPMPYNVSISHGQKFVWYRNAKVATRSLLAYFANNSIDLDVERGSHLYIPNEAFRDYYKFAFVRHPVDRLLSAWFDKIVRKNHFALEMAEREQLQDFNRFVAWVEEKDLGSFGTDRHLIFQTRAIDLTQVDFLGRLESLPRDTKILFKTLGLPASRLPVRNSSFSSRPQRDDIDAQLRLRIRRLYAIDCQILGY